jgi:crossover junction endodeoxyribonuclease RuvC
MADFLIGFDPSLDGLGYAVIDIRYKKPRLAEKGVVKGRNTTWGDTPNQVKLALIRAKVIEVIAKYQPVYPKVFFERGFSKFNNSTQATFRARGALESELVGYEIVEFTPSQVKKIVADHGGAAKGEVREAIAEVFGIDPNDFTTEDESDALAVAYVGWLSEFKEGESNEVLGASKGNGKGKPSKRGK